MAETPTWSLHLFGGLRVVHGDTVHDQWPTKFAALLLAKLALSQGRAQSRDSLCELLWPGEYVTVSRDRLRQTVYLLRKSLGPEADWLIADRNSLRVDANLLKVDARELDSCLKGAGKREDLEGVAPLLTGKFLPEFAEDWLRAERDYYENAAVDLLRQLADQALESGDAKRALEASQQGLTFDPYHEESTIIAVKAMKQLGRTAEAARTARDYETRLRADFGISPSKSWEQTVNDDSAPVDRTQPKQGPSIVFQNVPRPLTRFFGRERDLALLQTELLTAGTRLATITGPGGSGKTRLACEFGSLASDAGFRVVIVGMVGIDDSEFLDEIYSAVGLPEPGEHDNLDSLAQELNGAPTLLVLDNLEHVVEKARSVVKAMLQRMPRLRILATSRISLRIEGEREVPALPLDVPTAPESPARLLEFPAVQMLVDRIRASEPRFEVTERDAPSIAALAQFLEGVPLAIELAAARLSVLTPIELLAQLEDRLDALTAQHADLPERHRAMRAALDWSIEELPQELRRTLLQLTVFQGGWTFEAAKEVCGTKELELHLSQLLSRSLIQSTPAATGRRFAMLHVVREFAIEGSPTVESQTEASRAHLAYFSRRAQALHAESRSNRAESMRQIQADHANFRAAIEAYLADPKSTQDELFKIVEGLNQYWEASGYLHEAIDTIARALTVIEAQTKRRLLHIHWSYFIGLAMEQRHLEAVIASLKQELPLAPPGEDRIQVLGALATLARNFDLRDLATEVVAAMTDEMALVDIKIGAQFNLANALAVIGEREAAIEALDAVYDWAIGQNPRVAMWCLLNAGDIEQEQGSFDKSKVKLKQALRIAHESGDNFGFTHGLRSLVQAGALGSSDRDAATLATLLGAEAAHRKGTRSLVAIHQRPFFDRAVRILTEELGQVDLERLRDVGIGMSSAEVVEVADQI